MEKIKKKVKKQIHEIITDYLNNTIGDHNSFGYSERFDDQGAFDDGDPICAAEGISLGIRGSNLDSELVGISQGYEGNSLVIGGSGSGKSTGPIMATLHTWKGQMVVTDPKGEHYHYYTELYDRGLVERPAILFDPTEEGAFKYAPYWLLKQDETDLVSNITEIARAIAPMPPDCREPYWYETKQAVIAAGMLYYYQRELNFSKTMTALMIRPLSETLKELISANDPLINMIIGSTAKLKRGELASHDRELRNTLMVFSADQRINNAFDCTHGKDENCFSWDDLNQYHIFIRIPEERIEQWSAPIRLMLTQLFTYLKRRPDRAVSADKPHVLLLLDEFARFGKIEGLTEALCTLRSKNVNMLLALQSLAQLDKFYGPVERRIICDNCQYKLILQAGDPDTQKFLSDLIGVHKTKLRSKGTTTDADFNDKSYSRQKNEAYLPRIFPHELATLEDAILLSPFGAERLEKIRVFSENFEPLLYSQLLTAKPEQQEN